MRLPRAGAGRRASRRRRSGASARERVGISETIVERFWSAPPASLRGRSRQKLLSPSGLPPCLGGGWRWGSSEEAPDVCPLRRFLALISCCFRRFRKRRFSQKITTASTPPPTPPPPTREGRRKAPPPTTWRECQHTSTNNS